MSQALHLAGGVVLPLLAFLLEAVTGICGDDFLDPMPTWWHATLVLYVPLANAWLLYRCQKFETRSPGATTLAWSDRINAVATGIAACYALAFLPLTPFALLALVVFGLGLLPLAPLLSLISALLLRRTWRRLVQASGDTPPRGHWHVLTGIAAVVVACTPTLLTDLAVRRLAEDQASSLALSWLRQAASEQQLLEKSAGHRPSNLWHELTALVPPQLAYATAYYRVTGQVPEGTRLRKRGLLRTEPDNRAWTWDAEQGEQRIGGPQPHLALIESKLESAVDAATATGYTEWTLVFENAHQFQQAEARALIQLPSGGVVSRLTLWVNGEEREAAFGGRNQVTQAYQAVVRQRRDPVLVTDQGADRVLMQCFPVPPNRGEMKIRLGITYPLALSADGNATAVWPRFITQNFATGVDFQHTAWATTNGTILTESAALPRDRLNAQRVRGQLTSAQLAGGQGSFTIIGQMGSVAHAEVPDSSGRLVRQTFTSRPGAGNDLVIVLDGSASMAATGQALAQALANLPHDTELDLWLSGDRLRRAPSKNPFESAAWLRAQSFVGGQDDTAALLAAYDAIQGRPHATLLWIHGPQPITWTNPAPLVQRFARPSSPVSLCDYSKGWSGNPRLTELAAATSVRRIDPLGEGVAEMTRVLREVLEPSWAAERSLAAPDDIPTTRGSRHLGRLWAREEVDRLLRGDRPRRAEAVLLAQKSQLVTSVTGAVVLETQAQYDAAGLNPIDPATAPSIPEPATMALFGGIFVLVFAWHRRKRLNPRHQPAP